MIGLFLSLFLADGLVYSSIFLCLFVYGSKYKRADDWRTQRAGHVL